MKALIQIGGVPSPWLIQGELPCIIKLTPGRMTIDRLQPIAVNTKHPSLSVWNSKATMWGQG